jgi:hypothetical protein
MKRPRKPSVFCPAFTVDMSISGLPTPAECAVELHKCESFALLSGHKV